jgi:hypothetical protein
VRDEPVNGWPLWRRALPGRSPSEGDWLAGYAELARFATSAALVQFAYGEPPAGLPPNAVSAWLYDELARYPARFVPERSQPAQLRGGVVQQIRAPRDIRAFGAAGSLDVAVAFAAMAIKAGLSPVLAVGRDAEAKRPHTIVLVSADSYSGISEAPSSMGVTLADDVTGHRVAEGSLLPVDTTAVLSEGGRGPAAYPEAVERGQQFFVGHLDWDEPLVLVDVRSVLEQLGGPRYGPLPDDTFLPMSLPPDAGATPLYAEQESARERLSGRAGLLVLLGPSGVGKSTVALRVAAERDAGATWVLDASSPETLRASYAAIVCRELGYPFDDMDRLDRDGFAESALGRVRAARGAWCLVLDNADGDPAAILPLLPVPGEREPEADQVIVVTTANPAWTTVSSVEDPVVLEPIGDADIAAALDAHPELTELVHGRAATLQAFVRALRAGLPASALLKRAAGLADDELRGPVALVSAALDTAPSLRGALLRTLLLPPDGLPPGRDAPEQEALDSLARYGVLNPDGSQIHRLIHRAAEQALADEDWPAAAAAVLTDPASFDALSAWADGPLLERLEALLSARPGTTETGLALERAASLMELRGRINVSHRLAERALELLDVPGAEPSLALARSIQASARYTNQHRQGDHGAIHTALVQMRRAIEITAGLDDATRQEGRARRLEALLRVKLARLEGSDDSEQARGVAAALQDLIQLAKKAGDGNSPSEAAELARALFNVAGPYITLAQLEPWAAREHLDQALAVYQDVQRRRTALYGNYPHPHIAACISGQALVAYYRAELVEVGYDARQRALREATEFELTALRDRFELEGPNGGSDTGKSSRLLTKIAYARFALNQPAGAAAVLDEAEDETTLPRLTAAIDERRFIERWARSPALASVRELTGGTLAAGAPVPEILRAVAAAIDVWLERVGNSSDEPARRTIIAAAHVLGLTDTRVPDRRLYDHVLLLAEDLDSLNARAQFVRDAMERGSIGAVAVAIGPIAKLLSDLKRLTAGSDRPVGAEVRALLQTAPEVTARERVGALGDADVPVLALTPNSRADVEAVSALARVPTPNDVLAWLGDIAKFETGQHVLVVTAAHNRIVDLAFWRHHLGTLHVEAMGMPGRSSPTAAELLHAIGATAGHLADWWDTRFESAAGPAQIERGQV